MQAPQVLEAILQVPKVAGTPVPAEHAAAVHGTMSVLVDRFTG